MMIITICLPIFSTASSSNTHDFGDITTLPVDCSYGVLFWTNETRLIRKQVANHDITIKLQDGGTITYRNGVVNERPEDRTVGYYAMPGDTLQFVLTNCSIDRDGDMCDVKITLSNVKRFTPAVGIDLPWSINSGVESSISVSDNNGLMHFVFTTGEAYADFSMTYYKSGTSQTQIANIPKVISTIADMDATRNSYSNPAPNNYVNEFLGGNEGFVIPRGDIYYDKSSKGHLTEGTGTSWISVMCHPDKGGNTDGFARETSAVVKQELQNATYQMKYGGRGCGIGYVFVSPYSFELSSPTKTVSKSKVYEGETFNYTISQYVPNNYYAGEMSFIGNTGGRYTSFSIQDELSSDLNVDKNSIRVVDETGKNMSGYFSISCNNNIVTATAYSQSLNTPNFYSRLYKLIIPVSVKQGTGLNRGTVSNQAKTTAYMSGKAPETKYTSIVNVSLKYKSVIQSQIDHGTTYVNSGTSTNSSTTYTRNDINHNASISDTVNFQVSYGYKIASLVVDGQQVSTSNLRLNNGIYSYIFSDSNVKQNIKHTIEVRTTLKDSYVNVNYVDNNGNTIANSERINGKVFDRYTTNAKSIHGYILTQTPQNASGQMTEAPITVTYVYRPYSARVEVSKRDSNTGNVITKDDTIFAIYEWQASSNTWVRPTHINTSTISGTVSDGKGAILKERTSGTKGSYTVSLYYDLSNQGKFKVVEYTRPWGYVNSNWAKEIQVSQDGQVFSYASEVRNTPVKGQIGFKKNDSEVNYKNELFNENYAQGDASLQGAVYGVYAKENIVSPDTGEVIYPAGRQIMTGTTDGNGKITWSNLYLGKYYVQEITPSTGYLKDNTQYEIDLKTYYQNNYYNRGDQTTGNVIYRNTQTDSQDENSEQRIISRETVKKQGFQLTKLGLSENSTIANPLQGAGFKIFLIKDLRQVKNGEITTDANGNYRTEDLKRIDFTKEQTAFDFTNNPNGSRIPELFSNEDGVIVSPELAYGKYVVIESTIPEGFQAIEPFVVDVNEDNRKPKKMIYPIDREFEARIKVVKKDDTTGKAVLKKSAAYRIWDMSKNQYVEQWVTYPNKVQYGTEENPYRTTEEGFLLTPDTLTKGEYELREVEAPEGYVIAGKEENPKPNVRFSINTNIVYEMDPDLGTRNAVITVEQRNTPQKGRVTVTKQGEFLQNTQQQTEQYQFTYQQRPVADAKFAIYAKEDIYTQDNQMDENGERTKLYSKNQFVKEVATNAEGKAIFENLPLGEYVVAETKAGEGFILNTERKEVVFTYEGQDKPILERDMEYINERQKVKISVRKTDREQGNPLQGVKFGLYTQEEIVYTDNSGNRHTIPANELVAKAMSGKDGKAIFQDENLPLGRYYLKELAPRKGYAMNTDVVQVDATYAGQEVNKITKEIDFTNVKITLRIRVTDYETGANLPNTQILLKNDKEEKIGTYTVDQDGRIEIKGIEAGKQYSIEEVKARNGYVKDLLFVNRTSDTNELVKAKDEKGAVIFQVKDSEQIQTVTVSNQAKVARLEIEKTGEVLVGAQKDEKGEIVFQYENQRIDTAKFEIYAKEDIVHPDGKQGIILRKGTKVGEAQTKNGIIKIAKFPEELIQMQSRVVQLLLNRGLPLGEYEIREIEAPEGYQKEEKAKVIILEAAQDKEEIETKFVTIHNNRQSTNIGKPDTDSDTDTDTDTETVNVGIHKIDEDTKEAIPGVVFGLYAAENIVGADGKVLVEKDTLLEKTTTNQEGYAKFTSDLPISQYYVLEIKPAAGYLHNQEKIEVDSTSISPSEKEHLVKLEVINKKTEIKVAKIEKTQDTNKKIAVIGAKMQILDENRKVITEWVTNEKLRDIKGLETDKTYILHEAEPGKGYVTAEDIKFSIDKKGNLKVEEQYRLEGIEIPTIVMQDDITRTKITVIDKVTKKPIKDVVVQVVDKNTGEVIFEFTTNGEEQILEKLPVGEYQIVEKNLPNGYVSIETEEFTVKDTPKLQEKVIEHDITKLEIQFIDEVTKELLPGGKLEIRNDKGEVVATIDDTGTHYYVEGLPVGKYTIVEVETPEGYEKIEDVTFMLENSADVQSITIENRRLPFDLKVEKYASEVLINGVKQTGTNQVGKVVKIDINGKKISIQDIEVIYTIKVTNSGQIAGKVGKIIDHVPFGLKFNASKNETYWKKEGNQVTTTSFADKQLKPGESIELKIVLDWSKSEFNLGEKVNVATIEGISNQYGFEDIKAEDNSSNASIVISLKTGLATVLTKQVIVIILGAMILIGIMVLIELKLINKRK